MSNSGDPVFGDNIDEILSEKIINHTEMSEKEQVLSNKDESQGKLFKILLKTAILTFLSISLYHLLKKGPSNTKY